MKNPMIIWYVIMGVLLLASFIRFLQFILTCWHHKMRKHLSAMRHLPIESRHRVNIYGELRSERHD